MATLPKKEKSTGLTAEIRNGAGKGVARALRREGKIPGVLYGKGQQATSIALPLKDVAQEYQKGRFRSRLINIAIDGKTIQALPKDLQFNPVTDQIEHVDFIRVEKGVPLRVSVPVKFTGQEKSLGLKRGGVMNVVRHEIDFFCAHDAIPTHIEVNVQNIEIGHSIHINDVELPKGITPVIKRNFTVVAIAGRAKEEEAAPVAAAPAAAPAAVKKVDKK